MSGMLIIARGDVDSELWMVPDTEAAYRRLIENATEPKLFSMVSMGLQQDHLAVNVFFVPQGADLAASLCEHEAPLCDAVRGSGYVALYDFWQPDADEVLTWIRETKREGWSLLVPQDLV